LLQRGTGPFGKAKPEASDVTAGRGRERYDRPLDNVFTIESDIAHAIAVALQAKLSPKEKAAIGERPTSDLAAYDLYLKAEELRLQRSL